MDNIEKLMTQLDKDQPRWFIDWANERELRDVALSVDTGMPADRSMSKLRAAVGNRMLHRVVNAALGSGIVSD